MLVAIDTGDCGVGKLKGTHLHLLPNMYSGSSGKRYKSNFKIEKFFDDVTKALSTVIQKDDMVIILDLEKQERNLEIFYQRLH